MPEINPAVAAANSAQELLYKAIREKKSFRLEAGAGSGKTFSLIQAVNHLLDDTGDLFAKSGQRIACVTYTNVAKNEIIERTDNHPCVFTDTIHGFCWGAMQGFQPNLRSYISELGGKWPERIAAVGDLGTRKVKYDLGYPGISDDEISLHHDDVIKLMVHLLSKQKFVDILISHFPVIFIDEYQDTNKNLADAIVHRLIDENTGSLIGLFGDHWQTIYGTKSCGLIVSSTGNLVEIGKNSNFRSCKCIVDCLNMLRPELPQIPSRVDDSGQIFAFHTNAWRGTRLTANHWQGDLPANEAHASLEMVKSILESQGWEFVSEQTKILMLTNNILASEQGYRNLADCFSDSDDYIKLNDPYLKFFVETLEPICSAYEAGKFGEMLKILSVSSLCLQSQSDKESWNNDLESLVSERNSGSIGDVIELLKRTNRPRLSSKVEEQERKAVQLSHQQQPLSERDSRLIDKLSKIKPLQYAEVISLSKYLRDKTPFSTKHGVKGAEFENVLVVCGRGWNNYDWNQFLEWHLSQQVPSGRIEAYERNRNLFYVSCSRPKKRLALLFTQKLSDNALSGVKNIFGEPNVTDIYSTGE